MVHRLKSFWNGCKSLDLNALHSMPSAMTEKTTPKPFSDFTVLAHWLDLCARIVELCRSSFHFRIGNTDRFRAFIARQRQAPHFIFIILNFIKMHLPHTNIKPWIMSSGNHESTSNQLKITALSNTAFSSSSSSPSPSHAPSIISYIHRIANVAAIQVVYNNNNNSATEFQNGLSDAKETLATYMYIQYTHFARWSWIFTQFYGRDFFLFIPTVFIIGTGKFHTVRGFVAMFHSHNKHR